MSLITYRRGDGATVESRAQCHQFETCIRDPQGVQVGKSEVCFTWYDLPRQHDAAIRALNTAVPQVDRWTRLPVPEIQTQVDERIEPGRATNRHRGLLWRVTVAVDGQPDVVVVLRAQTARRADQFAVAGVRCRVLNRKHAQGIEDTRRIRVAKREVTDKELR